MLARFMRVPQLAQLAPGGAAAAGVVGSGSPLPSRGSYGQVAPAASVNLRRMGTSSHRVTFEG
jgi:hypothetical protein